MVELKDRQFYVDGKPFFMMSGEIHYYRMPPKMWDVHLKRAKEAGLNTVSSYIPWGWHEYEEENSILTVKRILKGIFGSTSEKSINTGSSSSRGSAR